MFHFVDFFCLGGGGGGGGGRVRKQTVGVCVCSFRARGDLKP